MMERTMNVSKTIHGNTFNTCGNVWFTTNNMYLRRGPDKSTLSSLYSQMLQLIKSALEQ